MSFKKNPKQPKKTIKFRKNNWVRYRKKGEQVNGDYVGKSELTNKILTSNIRGTIKIGEVMIFNLIFGSQKV